jgi:preprotein translocase subunit YajC
MQDLGQYGLFLYIAVFAAILYFLIIRPQQKSRKQHAALVDGLAAGDRIVTGGGLYGTVKAVAGDSLDIEISDGVVVTIVKAAVSAKLDDADLESVE